jgi:LmbE family N-acetylglucosaminyl deacetylase
MKIATGLKEIGIIADSKVLLIFAHPDDESVFAAGLIQQAHHARAQVRVITLTRGESGSLRYHFKPTDNLGEVRTREFGQACGILGLQDFEAQSFPDGGLSAQKRRVEDFLRIEISAFAADYVVTFEPGGITGHVDHQAAAAAVTSVYERGLFQFQLIYVLGHRSHQTVRHHRGLEFSIALSLKESTNKLRALGAHRSQFEPGRLHRWFKSEQMEREYYFLAG